ncbi:NAD(P)H-dependent oxidoreductase [Pacificispira sp.]|uniref:NAD(P)H-dependent oxidoreductase n=1 Tax=Pacificispira sp. TaxID=2888761 RepID=UPI003BA91073
MSKPLILGLSASLRNARSSAGGHRLKDEVEALQSRDDLDRYLAERANEHLDQFVAAGRKEGLPFDEIYRNLQKTGDLKGLSNSEICLAAGLWGAISKGAAIDHIPLPDHFPANGEPKDLDKLKAALLRADGIVLSTPVYFGDRGSLAQQLIEFIRADDELREGLDGKLFAGLAVGAKRNGGQETTLIYALMDMLNAGMLGVGNDSETTSQYGGTAHAGDVGTAPKDKYGIDTCIGTGRRIASVAVKLSAARDAALSSALRADYWILQDRDGTAASLAAKLAPNDGKSVKANQIDMLCDEIRPCIACDICPIHVGPDEEYRCIIKRKEDGLTKIHEQLLDADVIVPVLYSPKDRKGLQSHYQQFMERTRYLRRGDYVFTDRLVAPLIFAEIGSNESLDIRVMTSMIRHHTVIARPMVAWIHDGKILNEAEIRADLDRLTRLGKVLAAGDLATVRLELMETQYQPVGYVLASEKDKENKTMTAREKAVELRLARRQDQAIKRLATTAAGVKTAS